jgi:uncharacterized membrane protein
MAIFAFLLPLIMMNLLIGIMSSVYEKVQSNAKAADAKALAFLLLYNPFLEAKLPD